MEQEDNQEMPNYLHEQLEEGAAAAVVHERRRDRPHWQLLLDAGRVLMLWGWGALAAVSAAGKKNRPDAATATYAFLGLLLWLAGVSLVTLVPAARRFPRAARLYAAVVAYAVIGCFFPPWN